MPDSRRLLIDRIAAQRLPEGEFRIWAEGKRIFVSSVILGMRDLRAAALRAITTVGATPVMFETSA